MRLFEGYLLYVKVGEKVQDASSGRYPFRIPAGLQARSPTKRDIGWFLS